MLTHHTRAQFLYLAGPSSKFCITLYLPAGEQELLSITAIVAHRHGGSAYAGSADAVLAGGAGAALLRYAARRTGGAALES
jgi:hypothetical protein